MDSRRAGLGEPHTSPTLMPHQPALGDGVVTTVFGSRIQRLAVRGALVRTAPSIGGQPGVGAANLGGLSPGGAVRGLIPGVLPLTLPASAGFKVKTSHPTARRAWVPPGGDRFRKISVLSMSRCLTSVSYLVEDVTDVDGSFCQPANCIRSYKILLWRVDQSGGRNLSGRAISGRWNVGHQYLHLDDAVGRLFAENWD